jgi:hypothetical protein
MSPFPMVEGLGFPLTLSVVAVIAGLTVGPVSPELQWLWRL